MRFCSPLTDGIFLGTLLHREVPGGGLGKPQGLLQEEAKEEEAEEKGEVKEEEGGGRQ